MKQQTIAKEISLEGIGLHTGNKVKVSFKPAAVNTGIRFLRKDLPHSPSIQASFSNVLTQSSIPRCTSIGVKGAEIHTVEHIMAVLYGLAIDNLTIELDGNEIPGLDGSGVEFLSLFKKAGIVKQEAEREILDIKQPLWVEYNGSSIFVVPHPHLKISYTLDYDVPGLRSQFFTVDVFPETFEKEIAPCRTFCLESEAEELKKIGLGKGASHENTLIISDNGRVSSKVHFENECSRHKVLDFIGDLYLLGMPVRAHFFAVKSGHRLNIALLRKINQIKENLEARRTFLKNSSFQESHQIDISGIMKILPHRYPFLLVDRVLELVKGKRAVGLKNVTMNENFFMGHFPSRPVMPGVLMVEAMAQVGGIAVLTEDHQDQVAFFMAADNVKFRKVVSPGDQLIIEAEVVKIKSKVAQIRAETKVDGKVVAEADLRFSFTDASFLS